MSNAPDYSEDYDDLYDSEECWNCGGEGRVNNCIDGCCIDTDDIYCEYCSHPCDVCSPRKPNPELQEALREALEKAVEPIPPSHKGNAE